MLRFFAVLLGIGFIFAGVAGNMPMFMQDGLLFGFFEVNSMHNLFHIVTGVIAIMAATRYMLTKLFFKLLGIVYTAIAIYGFYTGGDLIIMHVNLYDNILHIAVGVLSLFLGFTKSKEG